MTEKKSYFFKRAKFPSYGGMMAGPSFCWMYRGDGEKEWKFLAPYQPGEGLKDAMDYLRCRIKAEQEV